MEGDGGVHIAETSAGTRHVSTDDCIYEVEQQQAELLGLSKYRCSCKKCHGGKVLLRTTTNKHLRHNGRDPYLKKSMLVSISCISGWCTIVNQIVPQRLQ